MTFTDFMGQVNEALDALAQADSDETVETFGCCDQDLPEYPYRAEYEQGADPTETARRAWDAADTEGIR